MNQMPSLSEILRTKLIPWSQQNASERFILARPKMRQADMPDGVQLTPHKIRSQRVIVKNRRNYNNVRNIIAEWPDAGLQELSKHTLICVLEGSIDYPLGNYRVKCGPGYFIFIPPGIARPNGKRPYVNVEESTSCKIITFLLHPNALEYWISHGHAQGRNIDNNCLVMHDHTLALLRALADENRDGEGLLSQIGAKYLNLFLEVLSREIEAGRFQEMRSPVSARREVAISSSDDFLTHLEHYVQTNLQQRLTLKTVSTAMYFSRAQFARVIRRETGKSFNEYLAEQRIAEAKELLRHTDWTVTAISKGVGIASHRYFRTLFKRHTGLTPTEFRAANLK